MTLTDLAKYPMTRIVAQSLCDSWASCQTVCDKTVTMQALSFTWLSLRFLFRPLPHKADAMAYTMIVKYIVTTICIVDEPELFIIHLKQNYTTKGSPSQSLQLMCNISKCKQQNSPTMQALTLPLSTYWMVLALHHVKQTSWLAHGDQYTWSL